MANQELGNKLLGLRREVLYLMLILATTIPLFFNVKLPNEPKPESVAFFEAITNIPEGSTVIIQSDWTESTKGENGGSMQALLRTLMRKKVKFAILSASDPQAPKVARNMVNKVNLELPEADRYKKWQDWVELGFFPNAEGLGTAISTDIRKAFGARRDSGVGAEGLQPVFQSPVLKDIHKVEDLAAYVVVTGTKSIVIAIERFSRQVNMLGMITGVMGPETLNYYISNQLKGLAVGLKGTYDLEYLMDQYPPFQGQQNIDRGPRYVLALHAAIFLLIIMVVIGNIGVFLTRGAKK
jgi:hypothetical protein